MAENEVKRIANIIVTELDSFRARFVPQTFESSYVPAFNFTKLVGPTPGLDVAAALNNQQKLLAGEPFVAYVRAIETKRRWSDDSIISSGEVIYLINRYGNAGISPETPNARFIPNGTHLGALAEEDLGKVEKRIGPKDLGWYLEIEILEKDQFVFDRKTFDATSNQFEFDWGSILVASLRKQLSSDSVESIESWELLSDAFGLRDRPNLDKWQGTVSRLPLDSRLIFSGFPGTGKTTTMIRRLAFKSNPVHVDEYEHGVDGDLDSWVTFTPNDTLRSYLREAMTREGLLAPISKLRTWQDERKVLARDYLKIIDIESENTFLPIADSNLLPWTDEISWNHFHDFRMFLESKDTELRERARNLSRIPNLYRSFRRTYIENNGSELFGYSIGDDLHNKISDPEIDILILAMLETANRYFLADSEAFISNTNNDLLENIKFIHRRQVAIDEASDFSTVELGCMFHLANPRTRSVMIVGDLMQRMTRQGITDWGAISRLSNSFEICEFETDYRLTPKLAKIATILSNRVAASDPDESQIKSDGSPYPLKFRSTSNANLGSWLENRVIEIYKKNKGRLPTTAIITPNESDVQPTYEILRSYFEKHLIAVEPCLGGHSSGEDSRIRIFSSQYIKGLEFDAVFFINIDQFPEQDLIDKYLYVGLTRARAFLGVTFENEFPDNIKHVQDFFSDGDWSNVC